jgi:hypothetical protein
MFCSTLAGAQVRLTITVNAAYASVANRISQFMSELDAELAAAAGLPQADVHTISVVSGVRFDRSLTIVRPMFDHLYDVDGAAVLSCCYCVINNAHRCPVR